MMVLHKKNFNQKNMEFAMLSRLFYIRTVHRKPSSKAHSNVAYRGVVIFIMFMCGALHVQRLLVAYVYGTVMNKEFKTSSV